MIGHAFILAVNLTDGLLDPRELRELEREREAADREHAELAPAWPRYRCRECGADFDDTTPDADTLHCPDCGSGKLTDHD